MWTGDKFFEYKVGQKMVKESFKNGIQGLRESLENMADNNKFGLKVAPAGGYIYSRQGTVKQPSGLTKNQKNYWNVMESNSGKTPQGKQSDKGTNKPNISQKHDEIAHDGYYGRKQDRTNEYNTFMSEKNKIVGDNTNGYRITELTKWMQDMGMTQIKEKLKRKSWTDKDGFNWQWDSQHGRLEKWNRRRTEHLGEFHPVTGNKTKDGESSRRWDG